MNGKIIEESAEQTRAYEQAKAARAQNGAISPEQAELAERRAARTRQAEVKREKWLEQSGFGAVIEKAEALLADLDRAMDEHQRAQAACRDLDTFLALAAEAPDDRVVQHFARRAEDLRRTIAAPPLLVENAAALRALIAKARAADLEGVNGVRNSNLTAAWRRRFTELLSPLPQPGHAAWCRRQVAELLREARAARAGR